MWSKTNYVKSELQTELLFSLVFFMWFLFLFLLLPKFLSSIPDQYAHFIIFLRKAAGWGRIKTCRCREHVEIIVDYWLNLVFHLTPVFSRWWKSAEHRLNMLNQQIWVKHFYWFLFQICQKYWNWPGNTAAGTVPVMSHVQCFCFQFKPLWLGSCWAAVFRIFLLL